MVYLRRGCEANFRPETVLLRAKDNEVIRLPVLREPNVELVIFQFEFRRECLDQLKHSISKSNCLLRAAVLPIGPVCDCLNLLVLLRHTQRQRINHFSEYEADLLTEAPCAHLKRDKRYESVK